jgi:hypothetical protein
VQGHAGRSLDCPVRPYVTDAVVLCGPPSCSRPILSTSFLVHDNGRLAAFHHGSAVALLEVVDHGRPDNSGHESAEAAKINRVPAQAFSSLRIFFNSDVV